MDFPEILMTLRVWTPELAVGFAMNLGVTATAMTLGSTVGYVLGVARWRGGRAVRPAAQGTTLIFRNVPMFVILYYMAFLLPPELTLAGHLVAVPAVMKAVIAFAVPVAAVVSDNTLRLLYDRAHDVPMAFGSFAIAWTQYLLLLLMGSTTASVIGVPEIVGRANTIIAAVSDPSLVVWIYGYVALWFLVAGASVSILLRRARARLSAP
jgi:polar amino acid transport system permease protein